jgi:hypothetical protein
MAREDEVKCIAYRLWQEEGCCHGRDLEHWLRAEMLWVEQNAAREAKPKPPVLQPAKTPVVTKKVAKKKARK